MSKYILGLGISGAIAAMYNSEFLIIVPKNEVSGQLLLKYSPPKILHATKETKELLNKLNIRCRRKRIRIGYFYNNKCNKTLSDNQRLKNINKKMNDCRYDYKNKKFKDLKLSVERNYIDYYDVDFKLLFDKILSRIDKSNVIYDKVILIDTKHKVLTLSNYKRLSYEHLISTIPFHDFNYIAYNFNKNYNISYLPVTYVYTKNIPKEIDLKNFDWIYFIEKYRASRLSRNNGIYVWEFCGDLSKSDAQLFFDSDIKILDFTIQRVGVIFSNEIKDTNEITFLGRLAQFSHSIKVQDIMKKLKGGM